MPSLQPHPPAALDALDFRHALAQAATPVTVITTDGPQGLAGVTCSAVCSVCDTPPTVLFCINRRSYANAVFKEHGVLCINWLAAAQAEVSQCFAGQGALPMPERFAAARWDRLLTGAPQCLDAVVALDCRVAQVSEVGSHSVFLAEVVAARCAPGTDPLVYCQRSYATTRGLHLN
ncbi:flavin reductase [Pseudorhodoferax sp.]|uniref:flavin reductase n=1 Tax=Pseudorhodoferax sp. TaxID=1993553 RepID=UPI002DD69D87|nr:flavin reductase [Pseudorhodoferax sp.]